MGEQELLEAWVYRYGGRARPPELVGTATQVYVIDSGVGEVHVRAIYSDTPRFTAEWVPKKAVDWGGTTIFLWNHITEETMVRFFCGTGVMKDVKP